MGDPVIPAAVISSESVEHYTPFFIIDRAIRTMGGIDIDPAADPSHRIPAGLHFTAAEDGLKQEWKGRIWLNPPFGREVKKWFFYLARERAAGRTTEAIVLWKAAPETEAWRILCSISPMICLPYRRINFEGPGDVEKAGMGASFSPALFYSGDFPGRFANEFRYLGDIWISPRYTKDRSRWIDPLIGIA